MLTTMTTRPTLFAAISLAAILLTGCASASNSVASPTPSATAEAAIPASQITTIDDGINWARGLDSNATADELSEGIQKIGDLVPDLDLWFQDNNEIGRGLISLNIDVLDDPANAGTKVDDLNVIVDDLEASIAKGNNP